MKYSPKDSGRYALQNQKERKTSNVVLVAIIIAIVLFTIACLYIQYATGVEVSSTLTTLWFTFWTVEIVALTGIKIAKVMKSDNLKTDDVIWNIEPPEDDDESIG